MITWTDGVPRLALSNTKTRVLDWSGRDLLNPMVLMWDVAAMNQVIGFNGIETATMATNPELGLNGTMLGLSEQVSGNVTVIPGGLPTSSIGVSPNLLAGTNYYVMSFVVPGVSMVTFSVDTVGDVLVIGGGGGGGFNAGGGGGAGAVAFYQNVRFRGGTAYAITVGAGGVGGTSSIAPTAGGDSQIAVAGLPLFKAQGGGFGGSVGNAGGTGGSGGGGGGGYLQPVVGGGLGTTSVVNGEMGRSASSTGRSPIPPAVRSCVCRSLVRAA